MTDYSSTIAGNYPGGIRITCILDEGAPTIVTSFDQAGMSQKTLTWNSEIEEGDIVAISNDTSATFSACSGIPLMEHPVNAETLIIGRVVSPPRMMKFPAADADANTLAKRLAGKYYRTALVEIWGGITKIQAVTVIANGTNACVPGVGTTLVVDISECQSAKDLVFDSVASGGVGVIPFHYMPAGVDGDTYTVLVGITGLMLAQS